MTRALPISSLGLACHRSIAVRRASCAGHRTVTFFPSSCENTLLPSATPSHMAVLDCRRNDIVVNHVPSRCHTCLFFALDRSSLSHARLPKWKACRCRRVAGKCIPPANAMALTRAAPTAIFDPALSAQSAARSSTPSRARNPNCFEAYVAASKSD